MSLIAGNAKKYSGAQIDYVIIFDWATGSHMQVIAPDPSGAWEYEYFRDMLIGITYVADGCKPISHGPYDFKAEYVPISGFILVSMAGMRRDNSGFMLDKTLVDYATWETNFSQTIDIGLFNMKYGSGSLPWQQKVIDMFDVNWRLRLYGNNGYGASDKFKWTFEVLDIDDNVLFALKAQDTGTYRSSLMYGRNLQSLVAATTLGSYPKTNGILSFSNSVATYTSNSGSNLNQSFTYAADFTLARKIRVGGEVTYGADQGGGHIKILPPDPQQ